MKIRMVTYLVCFFLILPPPSPLSSQENEETSRYIQMDNGLQVFLSQKAGLPLVNIVLAFDVGSKNETDRTNGFVHILEHSLLFFGTEARSPETIRKEIRRSGAYFNAHTGRDLTVFEMSLPAEYAEFALNHLQDVIFRLSITREALEKEKMVILEEINQAEDDPFRTAMSLIHQNIFPGHPYHRPVLGEKDIIKNASIEQIQKFYDKYFVTSNAALAVVGEFSLSEMEEMVNNTLGKEPEAEFPAVSLEKAAPLEKNIEIEKEMDVQQAYLAVGLPAPDYNHEDQYLVDLLTEVFGRGVNPLLYHPLAERRITPQSLRMGYSAYRYGGVLTIYLGLDPGHLKTAKHVIQRYFNTTSKLNYSKSDHMGEASRYAFDFLESAKNRIRYATETGREKGLSQAFSIARYMLLNELDDRGVYLDKIREAGSTDLRTAAGDYLAGGKQVVVGIMPQKKEKP